MRQGAVEAAGSYLGGGSHGSRLEKKMAQGAKRTGGKDRRRYCFLSQAYGSTRALEKTGGSALEFAKLLEQKGKRIFRADVNGAASAMYLFCNLNETRYSSYCGKLE